MPVTTSMISSASPLSAQVAPSDPHGTTGQVCNWVKSVGLNEIPEEIRTRTKYLILDGIGCALVGAKLPWSRTATSALLKMDGPGDCTLFGWDLVRISRFLLCVLLFMYCVLTVVSASTHSMLRF